MLKSFRRAYAVFKAYMLSDIVRSKGFIYGLLTFSFWILLFLMPVSMFVEESTERSLVSTYAFVSMLIFLSYTIATWDWAAELRWMINHGILEFYVATGSGVLPHFLGIMPVSLMWFAVALGVNCAVISLVFGTPRIIVHNPVTLPLALLMLILVLLGYALLLGGTVISSGTSGFVVELISFILPIATGGLTPLSRLPAPLRTFALLTPFSYPAELIRFSFLGLELAMGLRGTITIGFLYSVCFMSLGIVYFRKQLRKCLKQGFVQASLW